MNTSCRLLLSVLFAFSLLVGGTKAQAEEWIYYAYGLTSFMGIDSTLGIYAINSEGGSQHTIANGYFFAPTFSSDGDIMAFSALYPGMPTLSVYTVNRAGMFNLLTCPMGNSSLASFAPDGEHVVYQVNIPPGGGSDDGDDDPPDPRLPTPRPTNTPVPLDFRFSPSFAQSDSMRPSQWSFDMLAPNGNFIAIARLDGTDQPWGFHKAIPGQGVMEIWSCPSWHPRDINKIAVSIMGTPSTRTAEARIFIISPDGRNRQVLYDPPTRIWSGQAESLLSPSYSPDGNYIAYVDQIFDMAQFRQYWALFVMRSDGSDAPGVQLAPWDLVQVQVMSGGISNAHWSPDSQWVVFQAATQTSGGVPTGGDLFKVRRDGSGLIRLTKNNRSLQPFWYPGARYEPFFPPLDANPTNTPINVVPTHTPTKPAPTDTPQPTSTPIPQPSFTPTAPPVATNTPLPTPTYTPSLTPVTAIPTSTSTPIPVLPTPLVTPLSGENVICQFDKATLAECGWKEIPGGFIGAAAGTIAVSNYFSHPIYSSIDDKGLEITVQPKQVAFVYQMEPIDTQGKPVLLRLQVRANRPGASVALGAMTGNLNTGATDGSIATLMPASAQSFVDKESCLVLLYQPDQGTWVTPLIQVASTAPQETVKVLVDRLEMLVLDKNQQYSGTLLSKE